MFVLTQPLPYLLPTFATQTSSFKYYFADFFSLTRALDLFESMKLAKKVKDAMKVFECLYTRIFKS